MGRRHEAPAHVSFIMSLYSQYDDVVPGAAIDHAVPLVDAAAPPPGEIVPERFRLSDPFVPVPLAVLYQLMDPFQDSLLTV